jgi:hypothetical protein
MAAAASLAVLYSRIVAPPRFAKQMERVGASRGESHPEPKPIDIGRCDGRRRHRHQETAVDRHIRFGKSDLASPERIDGQETDVPRIGGGAGGDVAGLVVVHETGGHAETPRQLMGEVDADPFDRSAVRLALDQQSVAMVQGEAQPAPGSKLRLYAGQLLAGCWSAHRFNPLQELPRPRRHAYGMAALRKSLALDIARDFRNAPLAAADRLRSGETLRAGDATDDQHRHADHRQRHGLAQQQAGEHETEERLQ